MIYRHNLALPPHLLISHRVYSLCSTSPLCLLCSRQSRWQKAAKAADSSCLQMEQADNLAGWLCRLELLMQQADAHTACIGHRHKDDLFEFQGHPIKHAS